jgi:hypothetical protein
MSSSAWMRSTHRTSARSCSSPTKTLVSLSRAGCQVDHIAPGVRVNAAAYDTRSAYPQAHFLFDLAYCCLGGVFSGLDLARDEGPRRLAISAPGHQEAEVTGNNGGNNRAWCHVPDYSGALLNFSIASAPVSNETRSSVQAPELTSSPCRTRPIGLSSGDLKARR